MRKNKGNCERIRKKEILEECKRSRWMDAKGGGNKTNRSGVKSPEEKNVMF